MDLSIIIVNYNVKEFLQNLIHSIIKAGDKLTYEIIIADNASDDGSIDYICEKFPNIKLFANKENLGFGKANNQGLAIAKGKYILLINPDTIVQEDTFTKMIEFFERTPDAGLAGCKILNPDGTLQLACRRSFPGPWTSFCKVTGLSSLFPKSRLFARYNLTYLNENETYEVDAISGSFMMMRKEVYDKVGGFDEQFFMYGEDLDLCFRIQKAGYKVYYVHDTQIIHYKGESTKRSSIDETKHFYNAMHLFVKKHLSSSLIVEAILQTAIGARKLLAFMGRIRLVLLSILMDFIFFNLSLYAASLIYAKYIHSSFKFPQQYILLVYTIPAIIHIFCASLLKIYKRNSFSVLQNFGAIILSFFIFSSITFFFKEYAYSRAVIIITYILLFFTLTFWRVFIRLFFIKGLKLNELLKKKTLIIGINDTALKIAGKLNENHGDIRKIVGLIGFTSKDIGKNVEGYEVVGTTENILKVIDENGVNEVIFSSEEIPYTKMMSIVASCRNENVEFNIIGDNLDFLVGKSNVSLLDNVPLIGLHYNISKPLFKFIKNVFDYTLSIILLIFVYPFVLVSGKFSKEKSDFKIFISSLPEVLKGKKSLVGPRNKVEQQNLFFGKPGLTGLWYIEGIYDEERLNIFYAKNQNIWLDIEILSKTMNKMWSK